MHIREAGEAAACHGPVYRGVERGLWALAPAVLLLLALNIPAMQAAREQARHDRARDVAAENQEYCAKWAMPAGSPLFADCVRDLRDIRARALLRAADAVADDF